jgi:hypothetical protein
MGEISILLKDIVQTEKNISKDITKRKLEVYHRENNNVIETLAWYPLQPTSSSQKVCDETIAAIVLLIDMMTHLLCRQNLILMM